MLFTSYEFLFIFFPIVLFFFYLVIPKKFKLFFIFTASCFFYGFWSFKFLPLLLLTIYTDFYLGKTIGNITNEKTRKRLVVFSVVLNLTFLGFFKYFNFFLDNTNSILMLLGMERLHGVGQIILPLGISFYTFQSMSYTIDVYRSKFKPYTDFLPFAAYVTFFPHLIAGPIVRHSEMVNQLSESTKKSFNIDFATRGILFFVIGMSKKILIADNIAASINPVISMMDVATTFEAWACAIGYTFQLYFDFSGYTDMAIGLGLIFGVRFPQNFNSPYKSYSITDFWRRWHMTLSFWLRDYLYISLGGNRNGVIRTYWNLFLTMLLGGLWHGASWTFVLWGGLHGSMLVIEKYFGLDKAPTKKVFLRTALTFFLVVIGWVFFRAENMTLLTTWMHKLISFEGGMKLVHFTARTRDRFGAALVIGMLITWLCKNTFELDKNFKPTKKLAVSLAIILFASILFLGSDSPFLYFQF
jgi:alginate O-acetyltransferase complex protein AlgI